MWWAFERRKIFEIYKVCYTEVQPSLSFSCPIVTFIHLYRRPRVGVTPYLFFNCIALKNRIRKSKVNPTGLRTSREHLLPNIPVTYFTSWFDAHLSHPTGMRPSLSTATLAKSGNVSPRSGRSGGPPQFPIVTFPTVPLQPDHPVPLVRVYLPR